MEVQPIVDLLNAARSPTEELKDAVRKLRRPQCNKSAAHAAKAVPAVSRLLREFSIDTEIQELALQTLAYLVFDHYPNLLAAHEAGAIDVVLLLVERNCNNVALQQQAVKAFANLVLGHELEAAVTARAKTILEPLITSSNRVLKDNAEQALERLPASNAEQALGRLPAHREQQQLPGTSAPTNLAALLSQPVLQPPPHALPSGTIQLVDEAATSDFAAFVRARMRRQAAGVSVSRICRVVVGGSRTATYLDLFMREASSRNSNPMLRPANPPDAAFAAGLHTLKSMFERTCLGASPPCNIVFAWHGTPAQYVTTSLSVTTAIPFLISSP